MLYEAASHPGTVVCAWFAPLKKEAEILPRKLHYYLPLHRTLTLQGLISLLNFEAPVNCGCFRLTNTVNPVFIN